ncbi:MAG: DNA repair protein RadC [Lachnospiraceae bacterium]|nr:DNA repair protein RadC [Lachnospiraceae bacterium]
MNKKLNNYLADEKPYEKVLKNGAESLTDTEALAVILRTGYKDIDVLTLARDVLKKAGGSLIGIHDLTIEELTKIKGIGKVKAIELKCIAELSIRMSSLEKHTGFTASSSSVIAERYMERMRHLNVEKVYALFLDSKLQLIKEVVVSSGTVNSSYLPEREILSCALKADAVNMVLLHNHPSGDPTPSRSDISSTLSIAKAGELIGIKLLDHIVIGDKKYISIKDMDLF